MTEDLSTLAFQGENGRDEFHREQVADKVIKLLISDISVSPMIIDGDWGTGKTEFCHKLINKFRGSHSGHRLLYVDAFQADHADNPLMTILAEVLKLLPEGTQRQSFIQKALPVIRYGLKTLMKAGVGHILRKNTDDLSDELEETLKDAADKAIDASVEVLLQEHEQAEASLKALQSILADIAGESPIVLFIDELDRCRPDFAVQMLEVIKHTFDVAGVQFVLITNTRQLKAAINHCYGASVDAQRYLDKFLKFNFQLPEFVLDKHSGYEENRVLVAVEHFFNLLKQSSILKDTNLANQKDGVYSFTKKLITLNNLSLREVETFVRYLEIYQRLSQKLSSRESLGYQLLRIFGVYTFCFAPDLVEAIHKNKTDANKITALLGVQKLPDWEAKSYRDSFTDVVAVLLAQASFSNSEHYQPTEQAQKYWQDKKEHFFDSWGNIFGPIKETILTLKLGGA